MNMACVASGSCDAYYEFGLHAWDMAAGDLIIREAGGAVIDTTGIIKEYYSIMIEISLDLMKIFSIWLLSSHNWILLVILN